MPKRILIVAEHRRGHGVGHAQRCARLVQELDGELDWWLPEQESPTHYGRAHMHARIGGSPPGVRFINFPQQRYDLTVIDRRSMESEELGLLNTQITVGLDLGGSARNAVDYLIDSLPKEKRLSPANLFDTAFVPAPVHRRAEWPRAVRSVLIVFGGEHADNRAVRYAEELARVSTAYGMGLSVSVVVAAPGTPVSNEARESIVRFVHAPGELRERLADYDAVVTHFGITAYEAVWARVPVLLVHPSPYHQELAHIAGFADAPRLEAIGVAWPKLLGTGAKFAGVVDSSRSIRPAMERSPAEVINRLSVPAVVSDQLLHSCTDCATARRAVFRAPERTFFDVGRGGLIAQERFDNVAMDYGHDYFFEDYQRQYGRTYLEDFEPIREMGRRRVRDIQRVRLRFDNQPSGTPRLLDIGCAFGPFMSAASEAGFLPVGVDVNQEAIAYVGDTLGFEARTADVRTLTADTFGGAFDVVTMWYVIEHFADLSVVLDAVRGLVRPGGLFAFGTPNSAGVSGRFRRNRFFQTSPIDHHSIWCPSAARNVLHSWDFLVRGVRVTGHHPERFPGFGSPRLRALMPVLRIGSRLFNMGDTFEVIAQYRPGRQQS